MILAEWGDLMVPDKFNMVDMGGIDLIMMQGEAVPGLYDKLMAAISNCRYQCLYNWSFDGVLIPPTYIQIEYDDDEVFLNEGVSVTSDDVIHIYSVEPGPVDPQIIPLLAEENGVYNVPVGKDGFNPVTVDVPSYTPVINPISITENGTYNAPSGVDGFNPVTVNIPSGSQTYQGSAVPSSSLGTDGDWYIRSLNSCRINSLGFDTGVNGLNVYGFRFLYKPNSQITSYQSYLVGTLDDFTVGKSGDITRSYVRIRNSERLAFSYSELITLSAVNGVITTPVSTGSYDANSPLQAGSSNIYIGAKTADRYSDFIFVSLDLYDSSFNITASYYYDKVNNKIMGPNGELSAYGSGTITENSISIKEAYHKESGIWVKY